MSHTVKLYITNNEKQRIIVFRSDKSWSDIPVCDCPNFKYWVGDFLRIPISEIISLINFIPQ